MILESAAEMERDIQKNKIAPASLSIEDMGILARPKRAVKLLSFHAAKGREFGAVAMVDLNEGSIPFYQPKTEEELAEAQRLFYVGLTRAQKYLLYAQTRVTPGTDQVGLLAPAFWKSSDVLPLC